MGATIGTMVNIEELKEIAFDIDMHSIGVESDLKKAAYLSECLSESYFEEPKAPTEKNGVSALLAMYEGAAIEQEIIEDYLIRAKVNLQKLRESIALLDGLVNVQP